MPDLRFFTPVPPDPLGIDLAELAGGGACPAQFQGRTFDQRLIYVRYRDGVLSVYLSAAKETLHDAVNRVLHARVGPELHGDMSVRQACELAGLTVKGHLPDSDKTGETDLSGAVSYFQIWQPATRQTATDWVLEEMSGKPMVTIEFADGRRVAETETLGGLMVLGLGQAVTTESMRADLQAQGPAMAPAGQVYLNLSYSGWGRVLPATRHPVAQQLETVLSRRIIVAGETAECPVGTLALNATYATGDFQARAALEALSARFDRAFPPVPLWAEDLSTGDPEAVHDQTRSVDPRVAQWSRGGADRYVMAQTLEVDGRPVPFGWRLTPQGC